LGEASVVSVYVYKIWSGYDGFAPSKIAARVHEEDFLDLSWSHYIDVVEEDDDVWVFFKGARGFAPGIYAKGVVYSSDTAAGRVTLRLTERSQSVPIVSGALNDYIENLVQPRRRQVFVLPADRQTPGWCTMARPGAPSCARKDCQHCPLWQRLPRIRKSDFERPHRLLTTVYTNFVPGYWAVPRRSFIEQAPRPIRKGIRRTRDLFKRFKAGEEALAFPLAAAVHRQLEINGLMPLDGIVPVPLSPEKAAKGELDRVLALARELSALADSPIIDALSLEGAISRTAMKAQQVGYGAFEAAYQAALRVDVVRLPESGRILVLDDTCTEGSTLRVIGRAIRKARPALELYASSATLMAVQDTVANANSLLVPARTRRTTSRSAPPSSTTTRICPSPSST
jgi:hypothetical protein